MKLGSYVLTTAAWKLDRKVFTDVTDHSAHCAPGIEFIVVSSGAIASGMGRLGLKERPRLIPRSRPQRPSGR